MASGLHNQERVPENIKKQLALAVRSIQWSYAIFWSISATEPGVLAWGDGYYNGDIKTRKTVQSVELKADQFGLQRSEQLRELYKSLSVTESCPHASKRPSAALSPEDLTDTEWYYLVCMSFSFNIGQGLPGRSLANGQPVWLCNAHYADSKVFSRSLLAKSASIQTVVCFPYMRGVIELGVTEKVLEDPSLIHHVKTSFLDIPYSAVAKSGTRSDQQLGSAPLDNDIIDAELVPVIAYEDLNKTSPNSSSNFQVAEDSFMVEGINGVASQVQSWQFMDDDFSNCVHHSVNLSDCVSQAVVDPVKVVPGSNEGKVDNHCLRDVQDFNHTKLSALDLHNDDLHYQSVLSSLLKYSHPLILGPNLRNCHQGSSFSSWKKVGLMHSQKLKGGTSQKLLKKILSEVPRMHDRGLLEVPEDNCYRVGVWRPEADDIATSHVLSERKRRGKMNEKFMILKSIIPSITKVDKVAILDDTIQYLQQLERRVEELESHQESAELEVRTKRRPQDAAERTSDNYDSNKTSNGKRPLINKRKARDIDEMEPESGSTDNIIINMNDKEVIIKIECPWRDGRLLEIMDALSHLNLDLYSVQSSNTDGILSLTIKSKHKGLNHVSVGTIRKTLQTVAWKC